MADLRPGAARGGIELRKGDVRIVVVEIAKVDIAGAVDTGVVAQPRALADEAGRIAKVRIVVHAVDHDGDVRGGRHAGAVDRHAERHQRIVVAGDRDGKGRRYALALTQILQAAGLERVGPIELAAGPVNR